MRLNLAPYFTIAAVVLSGRVSPVFGQLPMTGQYVPELQAVDTMLQNFMVGKPIPGGTITITQHDKVIYERGIGYSNAANTAPMQETALMRLASVSKPITASAIQQLAKDGQLDLNAKVFNINGNGGILDIAPYNGTLGDSRLQDITVQHLLEHQGGWNRDTAGDLAFRDVQIANAMGVPSPPGILNSARYILGRPLQFTPGTDYNYSNIGYMFLGMVVEDVSGQPYETYVDNNVLTLAGIPAWEVDAGRTFAADQNPREPFYSTQFTSAQNVFDPTGPRVSWPYGGWDHEKFIALGGLIASSKAIAMLAQNRIIGGPEIGTLRSDYPTNPDYGFYHAGSLEGTDTLVAQGTWRDNSYSILFDRRPPDGFSYSFSLALLLESTLEGISSWPAALVYAGDFTNDQWLTQDDITLFTHALALGSEAAFTMAYPTARYIAGDFDGNGQVNAFDAAGLIEALQHAGVPEEFVALVPELPGDFNRDGTVDAADYVVWRKTLGLNINLPNETMSLGLVDLADYDVWSSNLGTSLGSGSGASLSAKVPEPSAFLLVTISLVGVACCRVRRRSIPALKFIPAIVPLIAVAAGARANIYQWEYINPTDLSQGKQQSATLAPDGAGVDAVPGADLSFRNLTMAYLTAADLTNADGIGANLTNADLTQANLTNAYLFFARLTNADLTGAGIQGANFGRVPTIGGTGISLAQLYSTASYHARDLRGVSFVNNNLAGANFVDQDLSNVSFALAILTGTDFSGAEVRGTMFRASDCVESGAEPIACGPPRGTGTISLPQLYSTASYQFLDLSGIGLVNMNLAGGNFAGQNLTNANLTGADVRGAWFWAGGTGLTMAQLYSTASYQNQDLNGINLSGDLSNWNFAGQNLANADFVRETCNPHGQCTSIPSTLTGANFRQANLVNTRFTYVFCAGFICIPIPAELAGADLTAADARGALGPFDDSKVTTTNLIRPDGHIDGLDLDSDSLLIVRDYDGNPAVYDIFGNPIPPIPIPITVDQHLAMGPSGRLRMVFEADAWDSTISLRGIPVALGGTLELTFAADVNLASQVGRTFDLFDWTGVTPTGAFAISSPYAWDLSNLYSTGEVTLTAVPEPISAALVLLAAAAMFVVRRTV